jgi:hypothetical protein
MPSGLFDAAPSTLDRVTSDETEPRYRAIPGVASAAAVVALLSPLAFLDWALVAVPALGLVLGLVAFRTILRRPDDYIGRPLALGAAALSLASLVGGIATLSMAYAAELPPGYERIHYGLLQPLDGDAPGTIPDTARAVDGRNVLLKGYMYPGKQQRGITQFLLVRDQGDCCFGGNPKITDRVLVQIRDPGHPQGIDFSPRITKITGRFTIRPTGAPGLDGGVIYHLEDAFVR